MSDKHCLAQARLDRGGGVADMDHKGAAADRGAVDPFRGELEVRHRLLTGGLWN
jgi:hypothetical protein